MWGGEGVFGSPSSGLLPVFGAGTAPAPAGALTGGARGDCFGVSVETGPLVSW